MGDLTANFSRREFASPDGRAMPAKYNANLLELATNLQVLRDTVGKPITIHSGYRSPEHNKAIGGASQSKHMTAQAADFSIAGSTFPIVYCAIEHLIGRGDMKQGGLGIYTAHLHYDVRGAKVRWNEDVLVPDCAPAAQPEPEPPVEEDEVDELARRQIAVLIESAHLQQEELDMHTAQIDFLAAIARDQQARINSLDPGTTPPVDPEFAKRLTAAEAATKALAVKVGANAKKLKAAGEALS